MDRRRRWQRRAIPRNVPFPPPSVDELYVRYRGDLKRFLVSRGCRFDDLEDALQEIFCDLVRRPPPAELRNVVSFLFTIAVNTLRDMYRRRRREPLDATIEEFPDRLAWLADDSTALTHQEEFYQVGRKLPRIVRVALLRRFREGWSYSKIGAELGCTSHTVKKYITRGLSHFRKHFAHSTGERNEI